MLIFEKKYAPTCFNDLIFPDLNTRQRLQDFADNKRHNSIILHGPYGTAKSTTANILVEERTKGLEYGGVDFHRACNVTHETCDIIHRKWMIEKLCGVQLPVSVFDEADRINSDILYAFRWDIDMRSDLGCFIFTTNRIDRMDPGLVDRCDVVELPAANTGHWFNRARWILNQENKPLSDKKLRNLLATCDGSIRDLMRALEDAVSKARRDAA
ncbi:AAA family ATPase [Labrenzia sp. R4_2]|uniref:AAA family ATPase n=1 Tax=Labrenzia sp. R4_2 TaxID=2821107 RepID=UPI001ADADE20|nr:AAA family ATPase [Labrenzia sp. R4_2]MBO9422368.1 AAA family ATPase [Labrenzia sp. R4_2]